MRTGRVYPDRGNSQRKSPEAGPSLIARTAGPERMSKGEERNDVDGGIFRGWATQEEGLSQKVSDSKVDYSRDFLHTPLKNHNTVLCALMVDSKARESWRPGLLRQVCEQQFGVHWLTQEWKKPLHVVSILASPVIPGSSELDEPSVMPASHVLHGVCMAGDSENPFPISALPHWAH